MFVSSRDYALKSSSNDDDIVQALVTHASSKAKGKKATSSHVPSVPLDGVSFHMKEGTSMWKYAVKRNIFPYAKKGQVCGSMLLRGTLLMKRSDQIVHKSALSSWILS